jgi:predicted transposase/invertase (TIGR01784 family)
MPAGPPHDALFKAAFSRPELARSELELVLPAALARQLDLASLSVTPGSFVDEDLRHAHSDLLYTVRTSSGREALVYVLLEHQSSFDALMPIRLLRYVIRIWDHWLCAHPNARRVPLVIPVVMHHGPPGSERWLAAPELSTVLDAEPELADAARACTPHYRFVLDDLSALTIDELSARTLDAMAKLIEVGFWSSRSWERLGEAAPLIATLLEAVKDDEPTRTLVTQFYLYVLRAAQPEVALEDVRTILLDVAGPRRREDVMNAAEQLIEQGRAEGRAEGTAALRNGIATVLSAHAIELSELGRARLGACDDIRILTVWLTRAATARTEAEVFGL